MRQFVVSALLLAVIPMLLLNPMGREAFVGYYAGVIAMWFVLVCVGRAPRGAGASH
jgi:hypothetical protein